MKQGDMLAAKRAFDFKSGRSRVKVKAGDLFMVTSPKQNNADGAMIDRKQRAVINGGYWFTKEQLAELFEAI